MQAIDAKAALKEDKNAGVKACFSALCLCCIGSGCNRQAIRKSYGIHGNYFMDCILHLFCSTCAVTQEWQHVATEEFKDPKTTICNMPQSK